MKTLNEFFDQQMENPEFRTEYEKIQPEMDIIRAIVDARLSQNLTQKELAERTGINQAFFIRKGIMTSTDHNPLYLSYFTAFCFFE